MHERVNHLSLISQLFFLIAKRRTDIVIRKNKTRVLENQFLKTRLLETRYSGNKKWSVTSMGTRVLGIYSNYPKKNNIPSTKPSSDLYS